MPTLVVMPNSDFPDVAQVGVRGDVEDVEGVARKSSPAVQVAVSAAALASIQADPNVSCGAWRRTQTRQVNDFHKLQIKRRKDNTNTDFICIALTKSFTEPPQK